MRIENRDDVKRYILGICNEITGGDYEITEDSRLTEDLEFDSLDHVDLNIKIEDKFCIFIPDNKEFKTIKEAIDFVYNQYE